MELIDLLFRLIEKFVPLTTSELNRLQADAKEWRVELDGKKDKNKIEELYLKVNGVWIWRLLFAIAYIPLFKAVMDFMNPKEIEDDDEDED